MNFKFLLCCCTAALLAVGLGFGAVYVTGLTIVGLVCCGLVAALGAFAAGRALWGNALRQTSQAVRAIAASPGSVVNADDSDLEPLFAGLEDLR